MITTQAAPKAATAAHPNPAELREQIKQSILAAQDAARQAAVEGAATTGQPTTRIIYTGGGNGRDSGQDFPPQVVDISIAFFIMCAVMVIGWPLARAFGRRLERRADVPQVNAGTSQQLHRIEQAVESMAIEVERISESQRFLAKLQNAQAPSRELKSS